MGLKFGQLMKIRGIVYYTLSPFEQRAFAGAVSKGFPNTFRRIQEQFFRVIPPFIMSYIVYTAVEKDHHHRMRKNPEEFECDE